MKYSIRKQLILIFVSMMTGTMLLCLAINSIFLEEFYSKNYQNNLKNAYYQVALANSSGKVLTDEFNIELQKICSKYNIEVLLFNSDNESIISSVSQTETAILTKRLLDNIWRPSTKEDVIEENADYVIEKTIDKRTNTQYIEMWGFLENQNLFLFRTSVEGINENAATANTFLMYVGAFSIVLGSIIIYFVSRKLTEPITELTKISAKMTNLDFEAKYENKGSNEIAQLGHHMNKMSLTLEKTIAELKSANHQLEKDIEKKEEIDIMRKEFISNVSHELKTPIAIIQGYAEGLLDGVSNNQEGKDYYCEVIVDEAHKMNEVVSKLLALNQLEFGNNKVKLERINIGDLINRNIQEMNILIKQKEIRINTIKEEGIFVWADEYQIGEVFKNYLSNAIHYVTGEKQIDIKIENLETGKIRVSVYNTGDVIPEEAVPYLWDKFYKVDKARTREYGGSGIGLSIVKAIMETLDQKYGVINYPNGVAFWFEVEKI